MGRSESRVIAFIPVRGGSKSIPKKNVKLLAGRPLVYWALDAATGCAEIERVVVSTDDSEIARIVEAYGSDRVEVVSRGPETATDTASTESALLEYSRSADYDLMVLIQATSPLLESHHLAEGLAELHRNQANSLASVVRQKRFVWRKMEDGLAEPVNYEPGARPRRQDFDGMLVENGAFYITSREGLLTSGSRLNGRMGVYEMPDTSYFEIDEPEDWLIVENLLRRRDAFRTEKAVSIKLLLTDVDGVLTDAGMYYGEGGDELKKFNTRDGKGLELLRKVGIKVGIITGEETKLVDWRARKLQVDFLHQGIQDKLQVVDQLVEQTGIQRHEIAYIGDDINDIDVLRVVGFSAAPADAMEDVKEVVDYICQKRGGEGCVREVAHEILKL